MLGAMTGDIAGSRFEWDNLKSMDFVFFTPQCRFTDDSVMTAAVAEALMNSAPDYADLSARTVESMRRLGRAHIGAGYGGRFLRWLKSDHPEPYGSFGNGAAMRISPVAWAARNEDELKRLSAAVTGVTHNHPEGLKGAEAAAMAAFLALRGRTIPEIRERIVRDYYPLEFTLDGIRPGYRFDVSCRGSVPVALEAFLESRGFEDAVRGAISVGGDSDTIAAVAGGIAEAYYGIPEELAAKARTYLTDDLQDILDRFAEFVGGRRHSARR